MALVDDHLTILARGDRRNGTIKEDRYMTAVYVIVNLHNPLIVMKTSRHVSMNASESACQVFLSKSTATNQQQWGFLSRNKGLETADHIFGLGRREDGLKSRFLAPML